MGAFGCRGWAVLSLLLLLLLGTVPGTTQGSLEDMFGLDETERHMKGDHFSRRHLAAASEPDIESELDDSDLLSEDLEEAIRASEVKAVRKALKAGADPSQPSLEFSLGTPLHLATSDGNLKIVKVLVRAKANVNARDRFLSTPLHYAAGNGFVDIVKVFVRAGADLDALDSDESTPLHASATNGHPDVIKVLVGGGAEIDLLDAGGDSALHQAAENGHVKAVRVLLDLGADKSIPDEGGATAYGEICEDTSSCSQETIHILKTLLS